MNALLQQLTAVIRRWPLAAGSSMLIVLLGVANYFLWDRQKTLAQRHAEVRHSGEAMMLSLTGASRVAAELNRVQEALKVIDRNLVTEGDLAENLGYFYQIETLTRVRLSGLNQLNSQPAADGSPYKVVPFSFRATGSYAQILRFLRELESGPRLLRVKSYAFGRGDAKTNSLALDLTVELLASP